MGSMKETWQQTNDRIVSSRRARIEKFARWLNAVGHSSRYLVNRETGRLFVLDDEVGNIGFQAADRVGINVEDAFSGVKRRQDWEFLDPLTPLEVLAYAPDAPAGTEPVES